MQRPVKNRAAKSVSAIALSHLVGGFVPLFSYIIISDSKTGLYLSCILTILALIIFSYFKSKMNGQSVIKGTIKVTLTGIVAAAAAFLLAKAVS